MPAYAYQATIDREPQRIVGGTQGVDIDDCTVTEAINALESLNFPPECVHTNVEIQSNEDSCYGTVEVTWYRLETSQEVATRINRLEQYNQSIRERRQAEYERLKQEFEGEV